MSDFRRIILTSKEERRVFSECYTFARNMLFELSQKPWILARCLMNLRLEKEAVLKKMSGFLKNLTNTFFENILEFDNVGESRIIMFIYSLMQVIGC